MKQEEPRYTWDDLPLIHQQILAEYVSNGFNINKAYIKAHGLDRDPSGYSMASVYVATCRLLKDPKIRSVLDQLSEAFYLQTWQAMKTLGDFVTVRLEDIAEEIEQAPDGQTSYVITLRSVIESGFSHCVQSITTGADGTTVKFVNRMSALETWLKLKGYLGPKGTEEDPQHYVYSSREEWERTAASRRKDAGDVLDTFRELGIGESEGEDDDDD